MIKALLLPLLLQTAYSAQDYGRSPLVDTDHKHEWVYLHEESGLPIWWDESSIRTHIVEKQKYPSIVLRVVANKGNKWRSMFHYQDSLVAIDCENFKSAAIDTVSNGQRVPDPWAEYRKDPEFGDLSTQVTKELLAMMRSVCGDDWSPPETPE